MVTRITLTREFTLYSTKAEDVEEKKLYPNTEKALSELWNAPENCIEFFFFFFLHGVLNNIKHFVLYSTVRGRSQDGGGLGRGDHFLSYKFIERTTERWTNFTKQLLIASRGHQVPRKAAHCLGREVGQNIKDKKGDKRARDGDLSGEGSLNRGSFQSPGNPRAGGSEGSFQISEGNLTGRKN